ncbi:uncharacterized protein THITE_2111187 [Thermothielavioides terrestris NRRL 8126]|jgi:hypothetical protein|uniref:Uncharacterized protein n=1 Tax=Thermothielavioides terrestris (strain ATCC 38088 / NRRL 8126) TaxID=578455 RepID=G2R1B5_THETT|nr:uncharacterized protein THITE_2111187 [Thermothielavioides terrestris NRRL 8126]AEO64850.1 hypothetical protein THITE_2111187 [Thermothielavioides terrestris NRRL 8126]
MHKNAAILNSDGPSYQVSLRGQACICSDGKTAARRKLDWLETEPNSEPDAPGHGLMQGHARFDWHPRASDWQMETRRNLKTPSREACDW